MNKKFKLLFCKIKKKKEINRISLTQIKSQPEKIFYSVPL